MFFFEDLPLELNLVVLDYANYFKQEHEKKFAKVLNVIKQFPKFNYEVSVLYRGMYKITYCCFEKDDKKTFFINKKNYLHLLKNNFCVYKSNILTYNPF